MTVWSKIRLAFALAWPIAKLVLGAYALHVVIVFFACSLYDVCVLMTVDIEMALFSALLLWVVMYAGQPTIIRIVLEERNDDRTTE